MSSNNWEWFGNAGHLICGSSCRFHLCTKVGKYLVSTVGEYFPGESAREIFAKSKGIELEGMGDEREYDFLKKHGYVEIGFKRLFETMVFKAGKPCEKESCNCGLPKINGSNLDFEGYNTSGEATKGHYEMCRKWSKK